MTLENIITNQWLDCSDDNYWVEGNEELNDDYFTVVSMPSDTWDEKNDITIHEEVAMIDHRDTITKILHLRKYVRTHDYGQILGFVPQVLEDLPHLGHTPRIET